MWKRATAKVPIAATALSWKSGVGFGYRRGTILPSILNALEPSRSSLYSQQRYYGTTHATQVHRHYYHSDSRFSKNGHGRDPRLQLPLPNDLTSSHNNPQQKNQRRTFRTTSALQNTSSENIQKNPKKSQKHSTSPKPKRTQPVHKMAVGMGMTLEECSNYLIKECTKARNIELNKRQRLKPWIMALLVHRYDRGIRDMDELNTDSVYFNGGRSSHKDNNTSSHPTLEFSIDLRKVLTPESTEIDSYIEAAKNPKDTRKKTPPDRNEIREILRHEKLALLATEARCVLIDREIPFRDLAALRKETGVRKLSKQDPSVFLSLFSRAFCVSEKQGKKQTDFSHRRFHPPSLKAASHKKKKLKRDRELAEKNSKTGNKYHRNSPRELQEKLRAMSQRNQ